MNKQAEAQYLFFSGESGCSLRHCSLVAGTVLHKAVCGHYHEQWATPQATWGFHFCFLYPPCVANDWMIHLEIRCYPTVALLGLLAKNKGWWKARGCTFNTCYPSVSLWWGLKQECTKWGARVFIAGIAEDTKGLKKGRISLSCSFLWILFESCVWCEKLLKHSDPHAKFIISIKQQMESNIHVL